MNKSKAKKLNELLYDGKRARGRINYNGMSVNNPKNYLKIRKIMTEPEIKLGQEFDGGIETQTASPDDELKAVINNTLKELTPRECKVLKHRFALDGHEELTLKEVGYILKVSRERIRQIEAKALRKLRHPTRYGILKDWAVGWRTDLCEA